MSRTWNRILVTLALVAAGDYFLFGHAAGCGVTLFALCVAGVTVAGARRKARWPLFWCAVWLAIALGASVEASPLGRCLLVTLGWAIVAIAFAPRGDSLLGGIARGVPGGFASLLAGPNDARLYARDGTRRPALALSTIGVYAVPIALLAVFAALIVPANLVLSQWTTAGFDRFRELLSSGLWDAITPWRVLSWLGIGAAAYGLLRFRPRRPRARREGALEIAFADDARQRNALRAALLTFAGLNALYLIANTVDLIYLWFAFELPEGMTHAQFAHQGAYRLIVAAVLAAVLVTAVFPTGSRRLAHRGLRFLCHAFVLQNLFVLAAAARRLELYVEVYGLTRFRVAALLWMSLVAIGFVLILIRTHRGLPVAYLFRTNAASTVLMLSAVAVLDIDGFIADWNVRQYERGAHRDVDVDYLERLDAGALPALARLARIAEAKSDWTVADRTRTALRVRLDEEQAALSSWRSWTWRRAQAVARTTAIAPAVAKR
ncbi:MAG: DUF4173 domain-containing protein [Planctomycetaceae bacterium]